MEQLTSLERLNQTITIECLSQSTKKIYTYHIKKWLKYYSHNQVQENITKHLFYLRTYNKSPEYIAIARASLLYYFNKVLEKPITIRIENPKRKKGLPKPESREVINLLIRNTSNLKHRVLIELIYDAGLRRGEVSRLKWDDLNLVDGELRVNQGKGRKDRLIGIGKSVTQHLLDSKDSSPKNNDYVFWSQERKGNHISSRTIGAILKNASKKAGLNHCVRPHQLRHSFATHSLEEGTDIRVIQELLGHSSPKTTMIYTKVTDRTLLNAKSPLDCLNEKLHKSNQMESKENKSESEMAVKCNNNSFNR